MDISPSVDVARSFIHSLIRAERDFGLKQRGDVPQRSVGGLGSLQPPYESCSSCVCISLAANNGFQHNLSFLSLSGTLAMFSP